MFIAPGISLPNGFDGADIMGSRNLRRLAFLSLLLVVASGGTPVFAQAGSTGGTIGKQGKSASGSENQTGDHRTAKSLSPSVQGAKGPSCRRVVGTWSWADGATAVFNEDGSGQHSGGWKATWACKGPNIIATWPLGVVDSMTFSENGNSLLITNNMGRTFAATRK